MTYRRLPNNLPAILRKHGLKVVEVDGWQTRGRPAEKGDFDPKGVLCHHTGTGPKTSNAAVVNLLVKGRRDLPGPLAQFGLARNGTVYIIASGRCNHAGKAKASGNMPGGDGNALYMGIEAFNDGRGEPWGKIQMEAYLLLCAVLTMELTKNTVKSVRGHKETSTEGKIDPLFDMNVFRKQVAAKMTVPKAAAAIVPDAAPNPAETRPQRCPAAWNKFKHLDPKHYMNYYQALIHLNAGDSIDIDGQKSKRGTGWALHWPTVGQNHLHDPKGLIKPSRRIDSLSDAEIARLKGPNGEKTHRIVALLKIASRRKVRVELELKVVFAVKTVKRWLSLAEIKALNQAGRLQFKALAESGGAIVRLEPAHLAGGTTILSFTKYSGEGVVKERAWPVVDYVRGTPKWR